MAKIHQTAVIDLKAELDTDVEVGPYSVIDAGVRINAGTKVHSHAVITGNTTIGKDCEIFPFTVIGEKPQDIKFKDSETYLKIGDRNIFREGFTIHRGTTDGSSTVVGDDNFFMANSHVAHNCRVGNNVVMVNGTLLAGHVTLDDMVFIGGGAGVHQFISIGAMVMIGGLARVAKDVPPYTLVEGNSTVRALNVVGMRRAGLDIKKRNEIKRAYKTIYHSGLSVSEAVKELKKEILIPEVEYILEFIKSSKRGICSHL